MNEQEHHFEELKQLLKLKRHEVPPPGFFNNFSDLVISRIEDGDGLGASKQRAADAPWVLRFLRFFEASPGLVGGFATSLCLLMIFGVVLMEHDETPMVFNSGSNAVGTAVNSSGTTGSPLALLSPASGGITVSTNPMSSLQPVASAFGQADASPFATVGFSPASGN